MVRMTVVPPRLSIVVPLYNESDNLSALWSELCSHLERMNCAWEVILVDDGSRDATWAKVAVLCAADPRVRGLRLRRNYGQTAALAAGFDLAAGEVVVPLDGDLQNDPADIPLLLATLDEGYDVVSGWRRERRDSWLQRCLPSRLANLLIARVTGLPLHDFGCTLKAYRRGILDEIRLYGDLHRFLPALAHIAGAKVAEVVVSHRPRRAGTSKYGVGRAFRVVLDLLTIRFLMSYATRPMHLFGGWSMLSFSLGAVSGGATLYMKWGEGLNMNRNPLLLLTAFLFFSGINFLALGLLGELITRVWHESRDKPIYAVRERLNCTSTERDVRHTGETSCRD